MEERAGLILKRILSKSNLTIDDIDNYFYNTVIYYYLYIYKNDLLYIEKSIKNFEKFLLNQDKIRAFCLDGGMAGLVYLAIKLEKKGYFEYHRKLKGKQFDLLSQAVDHYHLNKIYDLLYGYIGIGISVLDLPNNNKYKQSIIKKIIDSLESDSVIDKNGVKWYQSINTESSHCVCLGALHGIPSILSFLSICYAAGLERKRVKKILTNAIEYLFRQEDCDNNYSYLFAIDEDNPNLFKGRSRLAYCYGDLGVANSILNVGKALENNAYLERAVKVVYKLANKKGENSGVKDPFFCHGASGVLHIFNRFYKETNDVLFLKASKYWLTVLDDLVTEDTLKEQSMSLLTGKGGIILTLLEITYNIETNWDRILLIK